MKGVAVVLTFFSAVAVQARPGILIGGGDLGGGYGGGSVSGGHGGGGGVTQLVGVPDLSGYEGLHYPSYDLQELGTVYEGQIPPKIVKISNTVALKIPKPYPVKIPHPVPVPVPVAKPYPVPVPQLIKVPHPVPVEVIKNVPVPVEVPKPYPVPHEEYKSLGGGLDSYGGGFGGHQQLSQSYGVPHTSYGEPIQGGGHSSGGGGGYDSFASQSESSGHEGEADQSAGYPAVAAGAGQYETKEETGQEEQ